MPVVFARVDNRLVHGQVLEAWVPRIGADTIVVVDAELSEDPLQRAILESLDRPGLEVHLVAPAAATAMLAGELSVRKVLLLFAGTLQALVALEAGVRFERLNLGNVHPRVESRSLTTSVYLTEKDRNALAELMTHGVQLEARAVPADHSPDVAAWLAGIGADA